VSYISDSCDREVNTLGGVPSDKLHRHVAARIREQLRRKKWSGNQLADFAGISRSYAARLLNHDSSPTLAVLRKIAAALDVRIKDLLPDE